MAHSTQAVTLAGLLLGAWPVCAQGSEPGLGHEPRLELAPELGLVLRPESGRGAIEYAPGFAWGVSARVDRALPWFAVRPWVRKSRHAVSVGRGALARAGDQELAGARFEQPALELWVLGVQAEPTLRVGRGVELWAALGVDWGRIEAGAPTARLPGCTEPRSCELRTARRTGVLVEASSALGGQVELVSRWLRGHLMVQYGVVVEQSGSVFKPVQAFADGLMHHLEPLPETHASLSVLGGLGLLL